MSILLTGGAGYIGSHIAVELLSLEKEVVIYDNLSNSSEKVLDRIKEITGKSPKFYKGDLRDREGLDKVFKNEKNRISDSLSWFKSCWRICEKAYRVL